MLARREYERAEHAADRLGEACAGILRLRHGIRKAAAPGRPAPQRVRGEAVNEEHGERG